MLISWNVYWVLGWKVGESMIWTVVLWLGMQGQSTNEPCNMSLTLSIPPCWQTPNEPNSRILMEPNVICKEWLPDSRSSCDAAPTQFKYFKPAEHVFEIRTKRETRGWSGWPIACDAGDEWEPAHPGMLDLWYRCVHVTRELWMDGKRLGILKGLD